MLYVSHATAKTAADAIEASSYKPSVNIYNIIPESAGNSISGPPPMIIHTACAEKFGLL